MISIKSQSILALIIFFALNLCYTIWSFAFTDPNLVFSGWSPFWSFQQFMWQLPKQSMTVMFSLMISMMFICAFWVSTLAAKLHWGLRKWLVVFLLVSSPLIFSNNALSHDVFNYIFNARMVVKYQMDPHVQVAQHFFYDPWIRFMHNVHTPAPYFYGWTVVSVLPYLLGFEKFALTWLFFRFWSEVGLVLSFWIIWLVMKKQGDVDIRSFVLLLFNPLLMIELISNSHNDGWLMWPALASIYLVFHHNKLDLLRVICSLFLLLFSISTKYATALLIPIWFYLVLSSCNALEKMKQHISWLKKLPLNIFDLSAILLFLPLLTDRSQQFHPWYLSWCLFFYPLMKNRFLTGSLIILSVSSLLRYLPWLWNGAVGYTKQIEMNQKLITWVPLALMVAFVTIILGKKHLKGD